MQRRSLLRLARLGRQGFAVRPATSTLEDGGDGPSSSGGARWAALGLGASFFGFLSSRPYEETECPDPLNVALTYAWTQRRLHGDQEEAVTALEWVQARLDDADAFARIRFEDSSGDFRFQLGCESASVSEFQRALLNYTAAFGLLSAAKEGGEGQRERGAQLVLLRLKSSATLHALGRADQAEALLRKARTDAAAASPYTSSIDAAVFPLVSTADMYQLPRLAVTNGRALIFDSELLLAFATERLALFLVSRIPTIDPESPISKEDAARVKESKSLMLDALRRCRADDASQIAHSITALGKYEEELMRAGEGQAAAETIDAARRIFASKAKDFASPVLDKAIEWMTSCQEEMRKPFVKIPVINL